MAQSIAIQPTSHSPQERGGGGLIHMIQAPGRVARLACKCSPKNDMDFLIKTDRIVCAFCGREVFCLPPLLGVYVATCGCCSSASIKSTFILDSRGIYICTWCGRTR
jgi:hypothetical protein